MQNFLLRNLKTAIVVVTCLSASAAELMAQDNQDQSVTISFVPIPPFAEFAPDGTRSGFLIELSKLIADEIGVGVEFLDVTNSTEFVRAQASGTTQMIAGIPQIPPLREANLFSDPVAVEQLRPIVLENRASEFEDVTISGVRVGIVPPALGSRETEFLDRNEPVTYESPEAAVMGLLLGSIDVLLIPEPVAYSIARRAGADGRIHFVGDPFREVTRFVALHESRAELLDPINEAIAKLEADGQLTALRTRFSLNIPPPPPTALTIGVAHAPPLMTVSESGEISGYSVETLSNLAELIGLEVAFQVVPADQYPQGPFASRGIDALAALFVSEERKRQMDFSVPMQSHQMSIAVAADADDELPGLTDLAGLRVGAIPSMLNGAVREGLKELEIVPVASHEQLIQQLLNGDLDAIVAPDWMAGELAPDSGIQVLNAPRFEVTTAIALRFGLGAMRDKLDAVIPSYLTSAAHDEVWQKYFGTEVYWTEARIRTMLVAVGAALLLTLGGFGAWVLRARAISAAAVRVAREELETVFNAATNGIVGLDEDGTVIRANARARHVLGKIEDPVPFEWPKTLKFLDATTLKPLDESADPIRRALSGHRLQGDRHLVRHDTNGKKERYLRVDSAPVENKQSGIQTVVVLDDITTEERNKHVAERKGRLEALGQLTGGIAHDFNNLLTSLLYSVVLAGRAKDDAKRTENLKEAEDAIDRARALISQLMVFARKQPVLADTTEVQSVFDYFQSITKSLVEANIAFEFHCEEPDLIVFCDVTQLESALMNLILNSRDAILSAGKGNLISLKARSFEAPANSPASTNGGDVAQRFVEISVQDNGPGMDEETLTRATDPFFSTKAPDQGSGLGLAVAYGFAHQSNGDLRIHSEPGIGTTVQIVLPRGTKEGEKEAPMPSGEIIQGQGETILLVEDKPQILNATGKLLEEFGYKVLFAGSGREALDLAEKGAQFDLLFTDVVMPGEIGGFDLAKRVRRLRPEVAVLYFSGYTGFTAEEMGDVQAPLLQKPAPPHELSRAISVALGRGS